MVINNSLSFTEGNSNQQSNTLYAKEFCYQAERISQQP